MRLLATLLVLLAATYLHLRVVQKDTKDDKNIFVYINGDEPNITEYKNLLEKLRSRLANGNNVHGIAVTRPLTNITLQERFIQVKLVIGGKNPNITVIIDTVNVYVLGYLKDNGTLPPTLYYLNDIPRTELLKVFNSTKYTYISLGFSGSYVSLPKRNTENLGHRALTEAIRRLYKGKDKPNALLVIIQMVAEAVRIGYIQKLIEDNMDDYLDFKPDTKAISLENYWSDLSKQIQRSNESGVFPRSIQIYVNNTSSINIRNVEDAKKEAMLGLMLYDVTPTQYIENDPN